MASQSHRQVTRRSTPDGAHRPVMLNEVLAVLDPQPGEIAVDCTLGLAGHSVAILNCVGPTGKLIGLDWDLDQLPVAREKLTASLLPFRLHHSNFAALPTILVSEGMGKVDLLLADLGMSSRQVDDPDRGFSYVRDGPLDMRMDRSHGQTAAEILETISEPDLANALRDWGDEPQAAIIARALVNTRQSQPLRRTGDVAKVIGEVVGQPTRRETGWRLHPARSQWQSHPAARTFQALRLLVNRELANLEHLLRILPHCLKAGGRAAIISFHSGEDRLVKTSFRHGLQIGVYQVVAPEPIRASADEKISNPRSRSAKLRWARVKN